MCSNTQNARRWPFAIIFVWMPRSVSPTISPGSTSRMNSAPMMSNAQLSEAMQ